MLPVISSQITWINLIHKLKAFTLFKKHPLPVKVFSSCQKKQMPSEAFYFLLIRVLPSTPPANMAYIILVLISASFISQTFATFQQTALYRNQKRRVFFGNFKPDLNHQLSVTKITSSLVGNSFDCTLNCISEPTCHSFNMVANPDADGLYLCELLDVDKYRAAENDLQPNAAFHHFSPQVS